MRRVSSFGSWGAMALLFGAAGFVACSGSDSSGGNSGSNSGSSGSGPSGSGSSGRSGSAGSTGATGAGQGGSNAASGSTGVSGSSAVTGATGSSSSGGTPSGSTGSSAAGSGAPTGSGGATGSSASTGASGSPSDDGGTSGTTTDGGGALARGCPPASADVLADFEEGKGVMVRQGTPGRDGSFYTYNDMSAGAMQTPASGLTVAPAPSDDTTTPPATCNKYAMHSTGTGYKAYVGLGSPFLAAKTTYDLTGYDGIQFKIKAGTGGTQPVYFEVITAEGQPPTTVSGGWAGGTASVPSGDEFNHRGFVLSNITSTWQTVYVPFALLIPQWFPAPNPSGSGGCPNTSGFCQAPAFNPAHALGVAFSVDVPAFASSGQYDIWVDDITLYKDPSGTHDAPVPLPNGITPTFKDAALGSCTKPTGATGKVLQEAYAHWYARFVKPSGSGLEVYRPENNDVVSEGIAYGMLIATYMGDKTLFDGLWTYWKSNLAVGTLMTWSNPVMNGGGSATDADQDAAFALLMAGKKFGDTSYTTAGKTMLGDIWTHDIDHSTSLPTGGSNYGDASAHPTNPSYFAPAYYPTFASNDSSHAWGNVTTAVYKALGSIAKSNGLAPAWCAGNCTAPGSNGASTDEIYQYDAQRIPWRIGLDYCLNGSSAAKSYLANNTAFFDKLAGASGTNGGGLGRLADEYNLDGSAASNSAPNSMSLIGSAGVGAMASGSTYASFLQSAWQFVLDGENRGTIDVSKTQGSNSGYSYYNATVGLITLLTMSGNFTASP